jgi:hypothetical protein
LGEKSVSKISWAATWKGCSSVGLATETGGERNGVRVVATVTPSCVSMTSGTSHWLVRQRARDSARSRLGRAWVD